MLSLPRNRLLFAVCLLAAPGVIACTSDDDVSSPASPDGASPLDGSVLDQAVAPPTALPDAADAADAGPPVVPSRDGGPEGSLPIEGGPLEAGAAATNVVYVESNDPRMGKNAVLAFSRKADGSLQPLLGGSFATGGTGVGNPTQALGPDDSDQELIASADHRRLFAVNSGSNSIAVFNVDSEGALAAIAGSPFPSGGINPVSVGIARGHLYVVHQDQDPAQDAAAGSPNYTVLTMANDGSLSPLPGSTVPAGASPSIALISPDQKLLFGADFLAPLSPTPQPPLRAFSIGDDGRLTAAPGTPMAIPTMDGGMPPGTPAALGLAVHPTQPVLFVAFVLRKQIGVYSYDATGALTYRTATSVSGPAPCWIRANASGSRLYVVDTGDNSVSVLDTSDPLAPTEMQHVALKDPGPLYLSAMGMMVPTSQAFEESLSADGKFLYVLSQRTTTDEAVSEGNVLHVLSVQSDGKVVEDVDDVKLALPKEARPQGVVAF